VTYGLAERLRASLAREQQRLRTSLVLNPVENFPFEEDMAVVAGPLHGLYSTDKVREREERMATVHQFAGRRPLEADSREIYSAWATALRAEDATLRALSGLHAHIVLFMAMATPGQTVLILPIEAGGHMSGKAIVERLGLKAIDMVVDDEAMCVDLDATLDRCADRLPDYVFVDRSEGLVFEDFGKLATLAGPRKIFDASQYLTNVICGDLPNAFDWGFDLMIASIHKNFPGPQKALVATRMADAAWRELLGGVSTYVSNMHTASTYAAGLTLARTDWLARYSRTMLRVAVLLEDALHELGVPVVRRPRDRPATHHVWIREADRERAFKTFEALEQCQIMTNFRLLPYRLGFGVRLGVNAAVRTGLGEEDVPRLAELVALIRRDGATATLRREAAAFNAMIWDRQ
jgi:glycine hydroxymethyltransferase